MKKIFLSSLIIALGLTGFNLKPVLAQTTTLSFIPSSLTTSVGDILKEDVFVNPNGETIDTIRLNISFPPDMLELQNASKETTWSSNSGGNVLNNTIGYFSFGAGIPKGTTASVRFITMRFKALKVGTAKIKINMDSMALSDGKNRLNIKAPVESTVTIKAAGTKILGAEMLNDGDMVKGPNGKIYLIINNAKKYISSPTMLKRYSGEPIKNVSAETLSLYPDTNMAVSVNNYKNGTILRRINGAQTFLVVNGRKKYLSSTAALKPYKGKPIVSVEPSVLDSYPDYNVSSLAKILTAEKESLIRDTSSGRIYVLKNNTRTQVSSLNELSTKYRGKKITNLSKSEVEGYSLNK